MDQDGSELPWDSSYQPQDGSFGAISALFWLPRWIKMAQKCPEIAHTSPKMARFDPSRPCVGQIRSQNTSFWDPKTAGRSRSHSFNNKALLSVVLRWMTLIQDHSEIAQDNSKMACLGHSTINPKIVQPLLKKQHTNTWQLKIFGNPLES